MIRASTCATAEKAAASWSPTQTPASASESTSLPDDATWEDLQYEIYFRQAVDAGLKYSKEGRTVSREEARRRFGLDAE